MREKSTTEIEAIKTQLDNLFSYHAPRPDQAPRYVKIRAAAKEFALVLLTNTEKGADQSAALRLIREAVMTANASIALEPANENVPAPAPAAPPAPEAVQ